MDVSGLLLQPTPDCFPDNNSRRHMVTTYMNRRLVRKQAASRHADNKTLYVSRIFLPEFPLAIAPITKFHVEAVGSGTRNYRDNQSGNTSFRIKQFSSTGIAHKC
jgi:hypothetical protein